MLTTANYIRLWAEHFSRESCYKEPEIYWLMQILYEYYKKKEPVLEKTKMILIQCANSNEPTLYYLYSGFCKNGIIKNKHKTRFAMISNLEAERIKQFQK